MQIAELLRRGGVRLSLLLLIPVLAMVGASLLAAEEEPAYRLVATVVVTPPSGATGGAALSQAVEGFRSALNTDVVIAEAADKTGVPGTLVNDAVTSRRLGSSAVVEVIYQGPQRAEARKLIETQIRAAIRLLFGGEVEAAKRQQERAQTEFQAAAKALSEVALKTGVLLPSEEFRAKANEVSQLRVAVAQARARGDNTKPITTALAEAEKHLDALAAKVTQFDGPEYGLDRARDNLATADEQAAETQSRLEVSQSPALLRMGSGAKQPQATSVVRQAVTAGVIGLFIAIAIVAVLEVVRPRVTTPRHSTKGQRLAPPRPSAPAPGPRPGAGREETRATQPQNRMSVIGVDEKV